MTRKKYNFILPNGESAWATGSTVSDAIANAVKRYSGFTVPQPVPPKHSVTVKEFIEKQYRPVYFATLKPKTVDSYEQFLKLNIYPFMGEKAMNEVTVRTIQEFYNWMANGSQKRSQEGSERKYHYACWRLPEEDIQRCCGYESDCLQPI